MTRTVGVFPAFAVPLFKSARSCSSIWLSFSKYPRPSVKVATPGSGSLPCSSCHAHALSARAEPCPASAPLVLAQALVRTANPAWKPNAATRLFFSSWRNSRSRRVPPPLGNRPSTFSHPLAVSGMQRSNARGYSRLPLVAVGKLDVGMCQREFLFFQLLEADDDVTAICLSSRS